MWNPTHATFETAHRKIIKWTKQNSCTERATQFLRIEKLLTGCTHSVDMAVGAVGPSEGLILGCDQSCILRM